MIFPSESLFERRRSLMAKVAAGDLTDEEGFLEALRADPDDYAPLAFLGIRAEQAGDLSEAERYTRELIRVHPSGHSGYLLLARILGATHPDSPLMKGYGELGLSKLRLDEEAMEVVDIDEFEKLRGSNIAIRDLSPDEALAVIAEDLRRERSLEPAEVEEELRPHRLVHELVERRESVLDRAVVDGILEHGAACRPLLLGILKEYGAEMLPDDDFRMVEWALALLGEIGDRASLPAITEFLTLEEDDIWGPADWAFRRISFRYPAETLDAIFKMVASATASQRVALVQQITLMPKTPGRPAAMQALTQGLDRFPREERDAVVFGAIASFYAIEGIQSLHAASLERKYAGGFSEEARLELRKLRKEAANFQPVDAVPDELTVYDICCREPNLNADEDEEDDAGPVVKQVVKQAPKPGRNDPCWCGSGKKYKKCHLDQDERGG